MRFRPATLTILLLIAGVQPLNAQEKLLPVFHFQRVYGIFNDQIRSRVVRDEEGFVWIGTLNGLERYDGYSVKDYRNIPDDPHSLSSNYVPALLVDKKQRLWVGTYDAGVSLYDRTNDRFFNLLPRAGDTSWYQAKTIARMLEDRNGDLWLASRYGGVVRMEIPTASGVENPDTLLSRIRFSTYTLDSPHNSATDLFEREDGRILVASDSGLIILDPTSHNLSRPHIEYPPGCLLDSIAVQCIRRDSRGYLWVGTGTEGVFRLEWPGRTVLNYRHRKGDSLSIGSDAIQDIVEDLRGDLWIGSDAGIDLFSPMTGQCLPYLTVGPTPRGPSLMTMLSVDRAGTLWIGTAEGGVHWLSPKSRLFPHYGLRASNGIRPRSFDSIERDHEGKLWFTSAGIIFQIDITLQKVLKVIDVFRGKKPTFADRASFIDKRGTFWYGTWGLGLFRVDLSTGQVRNYGAESGLGESCIANGIAQGSGDSLWIAAHYEGLKKFDPATGRFSAVPGFSKGEIWTVTRDSRGILWVSSATDGVCLLDLATGETGWLRHNPANPHSLGSDHGRNVYEDPSGRVWIGTGNLINLWNPETRSFDRYANPAFSKAIFAEPLGADRKGKLWVDFLNGGLSVLDPSSGVFRNFDASDGLGGDLNDIAVLENGRMLLASSDGLNKFHPDSVDRHRAPPPLVITRMSINDESVAPPLLVEGSSSIHLPYSQNVLEFEFAAIDIDAPILVQYKYMLEGLEKDWVKPKDRRFMRYTSLPPGDYVLKVHAASSRGDWPEQEITLTVSIAPPWWQTWWFRLLAGSTLVGLIALVYRREIRRLTREKHIQQEFSRQQIESQEAERKRLAAELHDGLGQDLLVASNELQQFLHDDHESREDVERAAALVHESIQTVREISSNLHPHHLDRLGFCAAVEAMTDAIGHSTGLTVECTCDTIDHPLPKEKEIHVYRIIQEALSNVVRHARATKIGVHLKNSPGCIEVVVIDTGQGFIQHAGSTNPSSLPPGERMHGFGLSSMNERARIIGGTLTIDSAPGSGTRVALTVPHT